MRYSPSPAAVQQARKDLYARADALLTEQINASQAHLLGDCHNGAICPICKAESRAFIAEQRLDSIIAG